LLEPSVISLVRHLIDLLRQAWTFFRTNDNATVVRAILSREAHPIIQFGKYGFCGVLAVAALVLGVMFFGQWIPIVEPSEEALANGASPLGDNLRAKNNVIANILAFPLSNLVAYGLNILFVFESGRHSRIKEFFMFTGVSFFSFMVGLLGGPFLISYFGIATALSQIGLVVTSTMVNFVCRKFLIFKN